METHAKMLKIAFQRARAERERAGGELSQKSLAKALDVTPAAVSKWMNGAMEVPIDRAVEIAHLFGCAVADFAPQHAATLEAASLGVSIADTMAHKSVPYVRILDKELEEAVKAKSLKDIKDKLGNYEFLHLPQPHSASTLAFDVTSEAMAPMMPPQSVAFVDMEQEPEIGKPMAYVRDNKIRFALYKGDGIAHVTAPDWPTPTFELTEDDLVVGKVVSVTTHY